MEADVLLTKCVTLLCREAEVEAGGVRSEDLVKTAISKIKVAEVDMGLPSKRDTTTKLKQLVLDLCNRQDVEIDKSSLLQQIRIICADNAALYEACSMGIEPELTSSVLKRTITNIRKTIEDYFREQKTVELATRMYRDLNFGRHNIPDVSQYLRDAMIEMEVLSKKATARNTGIINSMNFEEDESMENIFTSVLESNTGENVFTTGFRELNEALQGGPRPGDTLECAAKQHGYKSAFSLTLFGHIAIYNKPKTKDPEKKPLLYSVSFEDPLRNNAQFLYQLLKHDETREPVDVKAVSIEEMWKYVQARMRATGYHVIMEEANPLEWTHHDLINRLIELEAEGFQIEVLRTDYLAKMKEPSLRHGSIGDDVMEQLSRVRAFCASRGILLLNPRQLSTEALRLESTVPAENFLNTIKGQGFFEGSKGLGRIFDIGILLHKCETQAGNFLNVLVDKHRFPSVIDSKYKQFFLEMPESMMPIPSNLMTEDYKVLRKIPRSRASPDDDFFS